MFRVAKLSPLLRTLHPHRARAAMSGHMGSKAPLHIEAIEIQNPSGFNFILGHAHFIQTADDLAEVCARAAVPKFGCAFCEASAGHDESAPGRRVRTEGNDAAMIDLAAQNALSISAGHSFIVFVDGSFPISILNAIKALPSVAHVWAATSNSTSVLVASLGEERKGIMGVIDGLTSVAVENDKDKAARKQFLRDIGYKR